MLYAWNYYYVKYTSIFKIIKNLKGVGLDHQTAVIPARPSTPSGTRDQFRSSTGLSFPFCHMATLRESLREAEDYDPRCSAHSWAHATHPTRPTVLFSIVQIVSTQTQVGQNWRRL